MQPYSFQSTYSLRSPTLRFNLQVPQSHLSIHRLLAEPDKKSWNRASALWCLSIHRLLAEPDNVSGGYSSIMSYFNPQAPCGAQPLSLFIRQKQKAFQSTGSLRSPTWRIWSRKFWSFWLSIHRLLAEPDVSPVHDTHTEHKFQSTGSLRSPTMTRW